MQSRSDAQRASKQKEMKEKELELCAFNAEHIEDSGHTQSLVRFNLKQEFKNLRYLVSQMDAKVKVCLSQLVANVKRV